MSNAIAIQGSVTFSKNIYKNYLYKFRKLNSIIYKLILCKCIYYYVISNIKKN